MISTDPESAPACGVCGSEGNRMCPCKERVYCSRMCQEIEWKAHKRVCPLRINQNTKSKNTKVNVNRQLSVEATTEESQQSYSSSKDAEGQSHDTSQPGISHQPGEFHTVDPSRVSRDSGDAGEEFDGEEIAYMKSEKEEFTNTSSDDGVNSQLIAVVATDNSNRRRSPRTKKGPASADIRGTRQTAATDPELSLLYQGSKHACPLPGCSSVLGTEKNLLRHLRTHAPLAKSEVVHADVRGKRKCGCKQGDGDRGIVISGAALTGNSVALKSESSCNVSVQSPEPVLSAADAGSNDVKVERRQMTDRTSTTRCARRTKRQKTMQSCEKANVACTNPFTKDAKDTDISTNSRKIPARAASSPPLNGSKSAGRRTRISESRKSKHALSQSTKAADEVAIFEPSAAMQILWSSMADTKKTGTKVSCNNGVVKYMCDWPECDTTLVCYSNMDLHWSSKHTKETRFVCTKCSRGFIRLPKLVAHRTRPCKPTDISLKEDSPKDLETLWRSMVDCSKTDVSVVCDDGVMRYMCDWPGCDARIKAKSNMHIHWEMHTKETPFKCDLCDRGFNRYPRLLRHRERYCPGKTNRP